MSDKFTLPLANRRITFTAMLTRLVSELNYVANYASDTKKYKAPLIFQVSSTFEHPATPGEPKADPNYTYTSLSASITTIINGEEIPVFKVDERQKDGWKEHMEDWISVQYDHAGISRFVGRFYSRQIIEPLKKLFASKLVQTTPCLEISKSDQHDEAIKSRVDNTLSSEIASVQSLLSTAMNSAPIHLKSGYSSDVWRKNLMGIFKPASGIESAVQGIFADLLMTAEEWTNTYRSAISFAMQSARWLAVNNPTHCVFLYQSVPYWVGSDYRGMSRPLLFVEVNKPTKSDAVCSIHNHTPIIGTVIEFQGGVLTSRYHTNSQQGIPNAAQILTTLTHFVGGK